MSEFGGETDDSKSVSSNSGSEYDGHGGKGLELGIPSFIGGGAEFGYDDDDYEDDDDDVEEEMRNIEEENEKQPIRKPDIEKIDYNDDNYDDEGEDDDEDDEEDEEEEDEYMKKFDEDLKRNYILESHPECIVHNYNEVLALSNVVRDNKNNIIDDLHKTVNILSKYEKTRIIGMRAKQINAGSRPYVKVPDNIFDGYLIAHMELEEKRLPFIIRRPLPNGASEYWKLQDLEVL